MKQIVRNPEYKGGQNIEYLLLQHAVGVAGGMFAAKKKVLAGAMFGALAAVSLLNILSNHAVAYPGMLKLAAQCCSGIMLGCRFSREDLASLRKLLAPAAILLIMLTGFNMAFAWMITRVSDLSATTAMLACAPGGVSDLTLLSADFGAVTEQVAVLQIFRFTFVVLVFPHFVRKFFSGKPEEAGAEQPGGNQDIPVAPGPQAERKPGRLIPTMLAAFTGSMIFLYFKIPAGIIIGSMFATILMNLTVGAAVLPGLAKKAVQICIGCYIGSGITVSTIGSLKSLAAPMLLILIELLLMTFVTAAVMHKATGLKKMTCLFSCIPGGVTEMGVIAEEMKLDVPKIVLLHTCRVIAVICMMPISLKLFL